MFLTVRKTLLTLNTQDFWYLLYFKKEVKNIVIHCADLKGTAEILGSSGFGAKFPHPFTDVEKDVLFSTKDGESPLSVIHCVSKESKKSRELFKTYEDKYGKDNELNKKECDRRRNFACSEETSTKHESIGTCHLCHWCVMHLEFKVFERPIILVSMLMMQEHKMDIAILNEEIKSNFCLNFFFFFMNRVNNNKKKRHWTAL